MKRLIGIGAAMIAAMAFPLMVHAADAKAPGRADPAAGQEREARRIMAEAADHALNSADNLLDLVTKSDRERVEKDMKSADDKAYKDAGDKFQSAWEKKFGQRFNATAHIEDLGGLKPTYSQTNDHRQQAIIAFPAEPGEKGYELHLIRERSGWWKINLPDKVDGKTFKNSLMGSINKVNNDMDKLPKDQAQAYQRVVTELLHEMAFDTK